ncbi:MAG: hypothetical protein KBS95_01840 [Alistipes sp.]|nr:hypothetical protein [Candidatus Alistipes equi]
MKIFRQKFTKTNAFGALIPSYIFALFAIIYLFICISQIGAFIYILFLILLSLRAISSCSYLIVTDKKFALINPYTRYYREFMFEDITHADICFGGTYAYNYLQIRTRGGKKFRREIDLVRQKDYNEILRIFEAHGIEVEKDKRHLERMF